MVQLPLAALRNAQGSGQGLATAALAAGRIVGDRLEIEEAAWLDITRRFSPPPLAQQVRSVAGAMAAEAAAVVQGVPELEPAEISARLAVCEGCEYFVAAARRCSRCGCYVEAKARWRSQQCPEGKWGAA